MAYANHSNYKQVNFFTKLKIKFFKHLAKTFPLNSVRVFALKKCGFSVGEKVYIGEDLIVASMISEKSCYLTIGDRVAIGPRVTLLLSSDANWSKIMLQTKPIRSFITLDDDCWLGAGVIILPGITIGKGAIVGAGSIVTKNVDPYTIVVGNPAHIIKKIEIF
mgnify:FL=1|jgi:maltose O-acetyltransferase